jgi:hypothetical protein
MGWMLGAFFFEGMGAWRGNCTFVAQNTEIKSSLEVTTGFDLKIAAGPK